MDTNMTGFSPASPRLDAAGHPRAALPGEAPEPYGGEAHTADPGASLSDPAAPAPAKPRRLWRTALLAGTAVLGVAAAGGAFLLSPYNTFVPVDAGHLGPQARQLAASAGLPTPPVVAPAPADRNIVYGMYSGLALLLDVRRPARPNGIAVLHIPGSGFQAPTVWDAEALKDRIKRKKDELADTTRTSLACRYRCRCSATAHCIAPHRTAPPSPVLRC